MARYLRILSVYYVRHNKKIWYRKNVMIRVFLALELPYQRYDAITSFTSLCSRYQDFFFAREHKGTCTSHGCFDFGKVWTNSMTDFWKYSILEQICMGQKNIESENVKPHSSITLLKMRPHYKTTTLILLYWTDIITPIWRILETLTGFYKIAHH